MDSKTTRAEVWQTRLLTITQLSRMSATHSRRSQELDETVPGFLLPPYTVVMYALHQSVSLFCHCAGICDFRFVFDLQPISDITLPERVIGRNEYTLNRLLHRLYSLHSRTRTSTGCADDYCFTSHTILPPSPAFVCIRSCASLICSIG